VLLCGGISWPLARSSHASRPSGSGPAPGGPSVCPGSGGSDAGVSAPPGHPDLEDAPFRLQLLLPVRAVRRGGPVAWRAAVTGETWNRSKARGALTARQDSCTSGGNGQAQTAGITWARRPPVKHVPEQTALHSVFVPSAVHGGVEPTRITCRSGRYHRSCGTWPTEFSREFYCCHGKYRKPMCYCSQPIYGTHKLCSARSSGRLHYSR